jgi:hypothetical protein
MAQSVFEDVGPAQVMLLSKQSLVGYFFTAKVHEIGDVI